MSSKKRNTKEEEDDEEPEEVEDVEEEDEGKKKKKGAKKARGGGDKAKAEKRTLEQVKERYRELGIEKLTADDLKTVIRSHNAGLTGDARKEKVALGGKREDLVGRAKPLLEK